MSFVKRHQPEMAPDFAPDVAERLAKAAHGARGLLPVWGPSDLPYKFSDFVQ